MDIFIHISIKLISRHFSQYQYFTCGRAYGCNLIPFSTNTCFILNLKLLIILKSRRMIYNKIFLTAPLKRIRINNNNNNNKIK